MRIFPSKCSRNLPGSDAPIRGISREVNRRFEESPGSISIFSLQMLKTMIVVNISSFVKRLRSTMYLKKKSTV